jgi:hypothetical protein
MVKTEKYFEDRKEGDRFVAATRIAVLPANRKIRIIRRIPKAVRSVIERIPEENRYSFWKRLE